MHQVFPLISITTGSQIKPHKGILVRLSTLLLGDVNAHATQPHTENKFNLRKWMKEVKTYYSGVVPHTHIIWKVLSPRKRSGELVVSVLRSGLLQFAVSMTSTQALVLVQLSGHKGSCWTEVFAWCGLTTNESHLYKCVQSP